MPDISKWDTSNVDMISYMFYECTSLMILPDINKWDTNKIHSANSVFNKCVSLPVIPNITKLVNIVDNNGIFDECISLINLQFFLNN